MYTKFDIVKTSLDYLAMQNPEEISWVFEHLDKVNPLKTLVEIGLDQGGSLKLYEQYLLHRYQVLDDILVLGIDININRLLWNTSKSLINFKFLKIDTFDKNLQTKVKEILGDRKIDYLMIDGDHRYEGVKNDFEKMFPLVRTGGIIAFHDVKTEEDKVGKFVKDLNYPGYQMKWGCQGTGIIIVQ
jgi:cephalosporin hydroxylase